MGKEQDTFEQEIRTEAETRVRRSLALDAFADAEKIDVEQQEVAAEVHRVAAGTEESAAVEELALANPSTLQRVQEVTRERKAMARLLDLATGSDGVEKPARGSKRQEKLMAHAETADTEALTAETREEAPLATAAAEEDQGTA